MKKVLFVAVSLALGLASSGDSFAADKKIRRGETVGAQQLDPGNSRLTNKGTINGGLQPGVTATGPGSKTIVNKGTITGSTGIRITGASSVTIVNRGKIGAAP